MAAVRPVVFDRIRHHFVPCNRRIMARFAILIIMRSEDEICKLLRYQRKTPISTTACFIWSRENGCEKRFLSSQVGEKRDLSLECVDSINPTELFRLLSWFRDLKKLYSGHCRDHLFGDRVFASSRLYSLQYSLQSILSPVS